ncbi:GLUG motif-containing protein, partial [Acinetobacter sp. 163]|nr:GLUG motif-containing protein [Acinetobacter sp. 163]
QDLSLEGVAFTPIPTFGGSFDGQGHTISGLSITESLSPAGLFGILQPSGKVENLTVLGQVCPDGDGLRVGGIVGENYGTLVHCSFSGTVKGKIDTG